MRSQTDAVTRHENSALLADGISSNHLYLNDQDFNIHYLQAGTHTDNNEIMLLIHGWPTSSFLYRHMMMPLTPFHNVIALDLPGFGLSDKDPNASFSFKYHATIIDSLLRKLNVKRVHLVVHDLGGPIALWWAKKHSDKVASYVLLNTIIYDDFSWAVKLFVSMTLMPGMKNWFSGNAGIKFSMKLGIKNKHRMNQSVIKAYQAPFKSKGDRQSLLRTAHRLHLNGFTDVAEHMENMDKPLCMIYAQNDVILPEVKDTFSRLKKIHPSSDLHVISECGHFLQEDRPEEVLKPLLPFYQRLQTQEINQSDHKNSCLRI
jgi:haloalkane dehalogenase